MKQNNFGQDKLTMLWLMGADAEWKIECAGLLLYCTISSEGILTDYKPPSFTYNFEVKNPYCQKLFLPKYPLQRIKYNHQLSKYY